MESRKLMRNMKRKKKMAGLLGTGVLLLCLTGCGNAIPDMTEEQNALVTEYAATLLLQYHADYEGKLVDTSKSPEKESLSDAMQVSGKTEQETAQEEDAALGEGEMTVSASDIQPGNAQNVQESQTQLTIAQVLQLSDFDISYTGYHVCDTYPDSAADPEELFFAMKAGAGNKLLVLDLQILNTGSMPATFDTLSMRDLKCKVLINEASEHSVYVTLLENDFLAVSQELNPGEPFEAALVTEIPEEEAQQIQSVKLQLVNGDLKTAVMPSP